MRRTPEDAKDEESQKERVMQFQIKKATKEQSKARIGLIGPSGSGKTYTALTIAQGLGDRVVVIDTENASASKYADKFNFDVLVLDSFAPQTYVEAIHYCESKGYDVIVIDSLSHAWAGKDGMLQQKDRAAKKPGNNDFSAWRDVNPHHQSLIDALVWCKVHLIITMRTKTEYVMEVNERGKTVPRKIGTTPIQRDGLEYEFDIVGDMDADHNLVVSKTRCPDLDGMVYNKPTITIADTILAWLSDGVPITNQLPAIPPIADYQEVIAQEYLRLYPYLETPEQAYEQANAHFQQRYGKQLAKATELELSGLVESLQKRQPRTLKTEVVV